MLPVLHAFKVLFYVESVGSRSRDKDGGHTIRSTMADNPMLYANFTTLSFTEPELLPIEVLHGGNKDFRVFLRKIVEIITFFVRIPKRT